MGVIQSYLLQVMSKLIECNTSSVYGHRIFLNFIVNYSKGHNSTLWNNGLLLDQ